MPQQKGVSVADKNTRVEDLDENMSADEAQELFGTEIDPVIRSMLESVKMLGFTDEDFQRLLEAMKELMEACINFPSNMTVEETMPYVYMSDLMTLGGLSVELYNRRDQVPDILKRMRKS
jgi:hypothetical protein